MGTEAYACALLHRCLVLFWTHRGVGGRGSSCKDFSGDFFCSSLPPSFQYLVCSTPGPKTDLPREQVPIMYRYYRSGTDGRCCICASCSLTRWQHCCVKWRHGRHLESVTSERNRCAFTGLEHYCQISPGSDWNDGAGSFRLHWTGCPDNNKVKENKN